MAEEKRVTWVELFFDLVFVFAVTQVSALLASDHSGHGVWRALIVFIPIYWTWVGTTMHANLHDVDRPLQRIGVFALGLCGLLMALAVPGAYESRGVLFGASYWAARALLLVLVWRLYRLTRFNSFIAAALVTGPLLLAGGLAHGDTRLALWAVAALVDLTVPYLVRRRLVGVPYDTGHLAERYGLFVIIALGESVVATGAAADGLPLSVGRLSAVVLAFVLTCALWWVYFGLASDAIRYGLRSAKVAIEAIRPVLPYGHLGFLAGIIAVAAVLGDVVRRPEAHLDRHAAMLLFVGAAVYLTTFGYTRWRLFRSVSIRRLTAAAVCLVLAWPATSVPSSVALGALTAVVVSLNVVEARHTR